MFTPAPASVSDKMFPSCPIQPAWNTSAPALARATTPRVKVVVPFSIRDEYD